MLDVGLMFDTIAEMLRGSKPDDLAQALGTDRTQTRRAMEIGLPALIVGLRDKTREPSGSQALQELVDERGSDIPADIGAYLAAGDAARGADILDKAFGPRGTRTLQSLSDASKLSTRLLAQVMSVLAPLATSVLARASNGDPNKLTQYLATSVDDLDKKGFGAVIELVADPTLSAATSPDLSLVSDSGIAPVTPISGSVPAAPSLVTPAQSQQGSPKADNVVEGAFTQEPIPPVAPVAPDSEGPVPPGTSIGGFSGPSVVPTSGGEPVGTGPGSGQLPPTSATGSTGVTPSPSGPDFSAQLTPETGEESPAVTIPPMAVEANPTGDVDADFPKLDSGPVEIDFDGGSGITKSGKLYWILAAILLPIALFLWQCAPGSGDDEATETKDPAVAEATPTPDAAQQALQASLETILTPFTNVTGRVQGDVAILNGSATSDQEKYDLDQAVRAQFSKVQNNVVVTVPAEPVREGYILTEIIKAQPQLSTFDALLNEAGLGEALAGGSPYTVFAPTNDAFVAMGDELNTVRADQETLRAFLQNHIVAGETDAATIAGMAELDALSGEVITIRTEGDAIWLNDTASVLVGDAKANNGVIHIIGGTLKSTALAQAPAEIGAELDLAPITFASGSANLTDAGKLELDKVAFYLAENPFNIEIAGHTDSDGDASYNQRLSQQRADAVKTYLVSKGVPENTMNAVGFGETQPIVENDTAANKALNRRIEFIPVD